jgi:hypothetical protein
MTRMRSAQISGRRVWLGRGCLLAALAMATQAGCTREFFREWANMDVSEAVFEKSRDPRWRLDLFSVEPPPLSRFANPYDPEVPPAPPDDEATEALSPVPQWPDNRLLIPVEGTGYLDLLEYWQRQQEGAQEFEGGVRPNETAGGVPIGPANPPGGSFGPPMPVPDVTPIPGAAPGPPTSPSPFSAPPAPNAPPNARPDASGPQAARARPKPAGSAGPSEAVVRMQDSPIPLESVFGARSRAAAQTAANHGTSASSSTPISLRNTPGPAAKLKIPPPKPGESVGLSARGRKERIAIPPPRSGSSIGGDRPRSQAWSIPPPKPASNFLYAEPLRVKVVKDGSVTQTSMRRSATQAQPGPVPPGPPQDAAQPQPVGTDPDQQVPRLQPRPPVGTEVPRPGGLDVNVQGPPLPPELLEEIGRLPAAEAQGLASVLVATVPKMDEAEAMGLPKGFRAYKVGMAQAWLLALINSRFYQYNLEQLYLTALPVTLQRFYFEPQFYAGMSPLTAPQTPGALGEPSVGFPSTPGVSTANSFNYQTRFAPTGQLSTLNLGTVAGFGKVFSTGGQILMGFANEVAFNFLGKNPQTPTVFSALPISFVQPLLRGGGRAVTLEPLTTAERNLLYQVRLFALFRQQFFVVLLTAGTVQNFGNTFTLAGFSAGISGNTDPTIGFIPAVQNIVQVEIDRRNVAFYENLVTLYTELIQGEASGLTQLQVDQVMSSLISARQTLFNDKITYRTSCDEFKMQMGLPPDTPIVLDQHLYKPFFEVFDGVDQWQKDPKRTLDQLPSIIAKFPVLEDIDVEGRSVLGLYRNYDATRRVFKPEDEDPLEDELQAAVRIALEYRLDLMNARAQLYDAWRQIRVTANALLGVFNLAITNNIYTPPGNTNPFAFLSEAKQFALTIQAELPLVRLNERNNFRTAIINYERARRNLQQAEDNVKVQLRNDLRSVHVQYISYEINKRVFELNVRLKDQSFEQIVAPPAGGTQALAQGANAATQTTNLLSFQARAYGSMVSMTTAYQLYEQARLIVYRDIGTLPYDEWEAFSELFPTEYTGPLLGQSSIGGPRGFTPPPEAVSATPAAR